MEEAPSHPSHKGTYAAPEDEEDDDEEYSNAPEPADSEQDPQESKGLASRPQRAESKGKAPASRPHSHGTNVPSPSPTRGATGSGDGNGNQGPPKNPLGGKRSRSPSPPSSPSSSSSDSGLSDIPRRSIKCVKALWNNPAKLQPQSPTYRASKRNSSSQRDSMSRSQEIQSQRGLLIIHLSL